jgi:hypothetical protein
MGIGQKHSEAIKSPESLIAGSSCWHSRLSGSEAKVTAQTFPCFARDRCQE